jgi:hypothetical protein
VGAGSRYLGNFLDQSSSVIHISRPSIYIEPEEVAHMAVFLSLDASGGNTEQALNISGGYLMD